MGCGGSKTTVVQPITSNELDGEEDETGSKHGTRGDSAVSKGTTDSGVVMEGQDPSLPGAVPRILPPLTGSPDLLHQDQAGSAVERPRSSEILEQLLSQGIIPTQPKERGSGWGAYNIMLDDGDAPKRRPPVRLESLRAQKEQSLTSRETIDHKMRLAEERRKQREDDLMTRLRTKSARVRAPAAICVEPEEPVAPEDPQIKTQAPVTPDPPGHPGSGEDRVDFPPLGQVREATRGVAEGDEREREDGGGGREGEGGDTEHSAYPEIDGEEGRKGRGGRMEEEEGEEMEGRKRARSDGDGGGGGLQREGTRLEELRDGQPLMASGEFESDPAFQHTEHQEIF